MNYYSTRDHQQIVSAAQAIACGLAPDGGLFVPESLPEVSAQQLQALCGMTYQQRAVTIMRPFLSEFTDAELERFTAAAYGSQFDDPAVAPVHRLDDTTAFLELWHGPTCAFKDMALQILPYLLTASLKKCGEQRQVYAFMDLKRLGWKKFLRNAAVLLVLFFLLGCVLVGLGMLLQ